MTLLKISELINSEGSILSLYKDKNESLFVMGNTENGKKIITGTNYFQISLFLQSRINLVQLYLMNQETHYLVMDGKETSAVFFEIAPDNIPSEISGLQYGNELFHLLPESVRTDKTTIEILEMLPPIDDGVRLLIDEEITIASGQIQFFKDDSIIQAVLIESISQNPTEFDYLSVPLTYGKGKLFCRLSPELLKLFLTNSLTIQELFKCQMDKEYFYSNEKGSIYKLFFTDGLESLIEKLSFGNLTYYSLPSTIDNPMEVWDYYTRNIVMSGHGVLPVDFIREYPVEIQIR